MRRPPLLDLAAFAAVFLATWPVELVLEERKYGLFGGGFGMDHALHGASEIALFLLAALLAHLLVIGLVYRLFRGPRAQPGKRPARLLGFAFFTILLLNALLAAKLELLGFFSDAVSFTLLRNLGGGSLTDALLFAMSESTLYLIAALAALVAYGITLFWVGRLAGNVADAPPLFGWRFPLALAAALPFVAFAADRQPDVRYAANRMDAFMAAGQLLHQLTDFDRDGYSLYSAQIDHDPFDARRHPLALDIPGDGIDQDGLAGDFIDPGAPPPFVVPRLPPHPKHLVLIVLESTRFDVLGKRIDGRPVAPHLEALARGGSLVGEAYSHVGYTTQSLKSLFGGQLEMKAGDGSLFRDLKRDGYRIGIFSGQPESFGGIAEATGMKASADVFVDAETLKAERAFSLAARGSLLVDEGKLLREFDRRLGDARGWARPTFVYFNFQSAHFPYHHDGMTDPIEPHPIARGDISLAHRAAVERTYYNAAAYTDQRIGEVIDRLKALGVWDDTVLAVTADHGESLFDDRFLGHGHIINQQQTRIPFVLSVPGARVGWPVGLRDYRAILLDVLAGRVPSPPPHGVFQYIGELDTPASIGLVDPGAVWTTMDMDTEEVWFSDTGQRHRYADLPPADRARADRLVRTWEWERWTQARRKPAA